MKTYNALLSGLALLLVSFIARADSMKFLQNGNFYQAEVLTRAPQSEDTGKHFKACVKIHHCLFSKKKTVSVNTGGKHYLQIYDSKGSKLSELTFTGKRYKLDAGSMAKGSYSVYVFDSQMKLLDQKPMVVK
ncbi:MAG TPA: hypothetical protein VK809_07715 [Bacteroidia bacterium]|jgi:hypothetical protein|nr:hypothetical protein [Bacteroidia bacterium]